MIAIIGWLTEYDVYFGNPLCFGCYVAEFSAEICEFYECLYVMFMEIMYVRNV